MEYLFHISKISAACVCVRSRHSPWWGIAVARCLPNVETKLGLAILALVDDDFVARAYLLRCFMGCRKLLLAKVIYLSLRLQDNVRKYVVGIAISLAKMVYSKAKMLDFVLPFLYFFPLALPPLSICLLMDAYFRICNTLATCRRRCICLLIKAFRGGQVQPAGGGQPGLPLRLRPVRPHDGAVQLHRRQVTCTAHHGAAHRWRAQRAGHLQRLHLRLRQGGGRPDHGQEVGDIRHLNVRLVRSPSMLSLYGGGD